MRVQRVGILALRGRLGARVRMTGWRTFFRGGLAITALCLVGLALSATSAGAVGKDDDCPLPDDLKNYIVSEEQVIYGTPASDHICAVGPGANVIVGGLLDDEIYAGGGDDVLIGGHGVDILDGGSGNDWLRGGTNADEYWGGFNGSGTDVASFADMTPVGTVAGMTIDLGTGTVFPGGDDLNDIDNVAGSAFNDVVTAPAGKATNLYGGLGDDVLHGTAGNDTLTGEHGSDTCTNDGAATACLDGQGAHRPAGAYVFAEGRPRDWGLVVMGAEGAINDSLSVSRTPLDQFRVTSPGSVTAAGANCSADGSTAVNCALSSARFVVVAGDDGNDTLTTGHNLNDAPGTIDVNGGRGNDGLTGDTGGEVLFTGEGGVDTLIGNGGADALISEGDDVHSGGDYLNAGPGNDQLVTDNACAGHTLWGGDGSDIIGFARQTTVGGISAGVHAQLGEGSVAQQAWAIGPDDTEVVNCLRSSILGGGETLEGTMQHDVLSGNDAPNDIWARGGNDTVFGNGGNDEIQAHTGNDIVYAQAGNDTVYGQAGDDSLWGHEGSDWLYGADGWDDLHALDGAADNAINCGAGHDPGAERDVNPDPEVPDLDPPGIGCDDRIPTNAFLTLGETLNGQPGYASVSGNVQHDDGSPVSGGYVNVNFQKLDNGTWTTMSTAHPTLSNGHYDVSYWGVSVGQWRVRAVFPGSQGRYAESESGYHEFQIKSGYRLVAKHSGKCASLSANESANGTGILQWDCSPSPSPGDGQVFTLVPFGNGDFQLKINSTGKCVDVTNVSYADGAWLQQWDCLGAGQTNQLWKVIPIAGSPYVAFQAKHSGKCADVTGSSTSNNIRLQQWTCHWGGNQQWSFQAIN